MMRLALATTNPDKVREIVEILSDLDLEILPMDRWEELRLPEETGRTFEENARAKAEALCRETGLPSLADDSGLEVDALGGLPGVRSARFAGFDRDYAANNRRLLAVLRGLPDEDRRARFVCAAALASPGAETFVVRGTLEGRIAHEPRGGGGFGYDPLFWLPEAGQTLAEVGPGVKNRVSHRARALEGIRAHLAALGLGTGRREPFR